MATKPSPAECSTSAVPFIRLAVITWIRHSRTTLCRPANAVAWLFRFRGANFMTKKRFAAIFTISVREADRGLSRTGALGGLERRTTKAGTYHQARQFSAALLISGGGASDNPHDSGMA